MPEARKKTTNKKAPSKALHQTEMGGKVVKGPKGKTAQRKSPQRKTSQAKTPKRTK